MNSYMTIARLAYQTFQIPVYVYQKGTVLFALPNQDEICYPPARDVENILKQENLTYFTEHHTCFSKLPCKTEPDIVFILGPVSSLPYTSKTLEQMHRKYTVISDKTESFDEFFRQIPVMTHIDFFYILRLLFYMINAEEITLDSFLGELFSGNSSDGQSLRDEYAASISQQKESEKPNNSYEIENMILTLVENGDVEGMKRFISNVPQLHAGAVAHDALRMQKNYFISSCTLATRTAIRAGVPTTDAFHLSDLYIKKLETLNSMNAVNQLSANALLDITTLVQNYRDSLQTQFLGNLDTAVRECILYVRQHTNQNLSVQSVADALGYHRAYLSTCFSKAMGFHLNDFIYRCKLEEGKALLAYTDKSISEISSFLCFSSQSHFQLRFKKAFHITPAKYRLQHRNKPS